MLVSYPSKAKPSCVPRFACVSGAVFGPNTKKYKYALPFTTFILKFSNLRNSCIIIPAFPQVSLRFIFQSGRWLPSFFPFKDRTSVLVRSRVVYKYTCQCCGALYLGQTARHLHTRISEHTRVSPLTGKKRATTLFPTSSIQAHTCQTNYTISPNDFSIISSCRSSSNFELLIRESLLISKYKPSLNENISSIPLSLFQYFPLPYTCHFLSGHLVFYWLAV